MQRQACGFLLPRESPNRPACMSVRDRIPELLAERGVPFEARNASKAELPGLLLAKLDEEIAEYLADAGDLARAEELADVLEVVVGVGGLCGADRDSVESLRQGRPRNEDTSTLRRLCERSLPSAHVPPS
jgi:predicted house-cleaning noncanonical NTP pyrophosphatase (MazG superfamily)